MIRLRGLFVFVCLGAAAAQTPKAVGDYSGMLGPLHGKLHLKADASGTLQCTLDSVEQGATGLPCANVRLDGNALTFEIPVVGGKWHGTVSADGATLDGSWSQGTEQPLVFHRDEPFAAAAKPSRVDGIWLGTLGGKLRVQIQVKSDAAGKEYCALDSLDQGAMGLPCDKVQFDGKAFSFLVPAVNGHWSGTLAENGNELNGAWSQGQDQPLPFTRQTVALAVKPPAPPKFDAALPAVPIGELKAILDRDLTQALKQGLLAPDSGGGVTIGVVQHGTRRIFVYGAAKEDSIFEVGSISKTFTGLILAQLVEQHKVKLDDPLRELLPPGTVTKPDGVEITLLDLATQHSGLPRLPDNMRPADPQDPYADYRPANLYAFVGSHGVKKPADAGFLYSNLGVGLLGQALANRAEMTYPELLKAQITGPLNLNDTVVKLSPEQDKRFIQGYSAPHQPAHAWNLDALAGAGAIRSTASDMLTYLEVQLHPDKVKDPQLANALRLSHELRADSFPGMKIGLAWLFLTNTGAYWHDGGTGGFSSYALFNPKEDYALVVLFNTAAGARGSFANLLGDHIAARLGGKPAMSLGE
jgi:D-alanyl-D-alanine-carboxypeptidase/D-alanyl-D-alanine-endopeptidase